MDTPRKKIRVVGESRTQLDVVRFANALIAFALHCLSADTTPDHAARSAAEPNQERPS